MKIGKICKVYIGIGMIFAIYGLRLYKKYKPESYAALSLREKVRIFAGITVEWPDPVINGLIKGSKSYMAEKHDKESINESES